jgi:hypothetical protein
MRNQRPLPMGALAATQRGAKRTLGTQAASGDGRLRPAGRPGRAGTKCAAGSQDILSSTGIAELAAVGARYPAEDNHRIIAVN